MGLLDATWILNSYSQFLLKLTHLYFSSSVLHGQVFCIYDGCSEKNFKVYSLVPSDCSPQSFGRIYLYFFVAIVE